MTEKLKSCPFCGREAIVKEANDHRYYVLCGKCGAKTNNRITKSKAIEIWNRRVGDGMADVQEVKHGKNLAEQTEDFICSNCRIRIIDFQRRIDDEDIEETWNCTYDFKFCPNCGARMDD